MKTNFKGWGVLSAVSLAGILSYTLMEAASTTANSLMFTYGNVAFTATQYGLGFTAWGLMQGLPAPLVGKMTQKFGGKKVMMFGQIGLAIVCLLLSRFMTISAFAFIFIFGVLGGLFDNACSQVPTGTILNSWFRQKNATAIIIRGIAAGVAGILIPYAFQAAIYNKPDQVNWINAYYLVGICSIIACVITALFIVNKPEDVGQLPDGGEVNSERSEKETQSNIYHIADGESIPMAEARKHPDFYKFCIMSAVGFFAIMSSVSPGNVPLFQNGFTYEDIVTVQSLGSAVSIGAMFLMMWLANRYEPVKVYAVFFLIYATSAFCYADADAIWKYAFFSYAARIMTSAANLLPAAYLANYYGRDSFPVIQGFCLLCAGLFSSTNSTIAGIIKDTAGSYAPHFYLCAILAIIAAICGFSINYAKKKDAKSSI